MAGDTRSTVALLASLLLLSSLPFISSADTTDVVFEVEETSSPLNEWYVAGDTVELTAMFTNSGRIDHDCQRPSCGVVLQVSNATGLSSLMIPLHVEARLKASDLAESETHSFDVLHGTST